MSRRTLAAVVVGAALFWAPFALGLPVAWSRTHPPQADFIPGAIELAVAVGSTLIGLWVARQVPTGVAARGPARRSVLAGLAVGHVLLVALVGAFVTEWAPLTDDEEAYRLQARLLLDGAWSEPAFPLREGVSNPFVVDLPGTEPPRWTGCYPLVAAALTAVGAPIGFDPLGWIGLGGLLVWSIGRLTEELWPDADGELAAALVAASPVVILLGAHKHTSMASTVLAVLSARLAVAVLGERRLAPTALGAALGLGVLTRPLDGGLAILLVAGVLLARLPRARWAPVALGIAVGAGPLAALFFAHNRAVTGHFTQMPYDLISEFPIYGFGETAFGRHTPLIALFKTATVLLRMQTWTFGWPWLAVGPAAYLVLRQERGPGLLLASAAALHLALYAAAPFGAVPTAGTTYHVWLVPIAVLAVVGGLRRSDLRPAAAALGAWAWLTFVPYAAWNVRLADQAALAPRVAAEALAAEHGPLVVLLSSRHDFPPTTYVFYGPVPSGLGDRVLWFEGDTDVSAVRALLPERPVFRMAPQADGTVSVALVP